MSANRIDYQTIAAELGPDASDRDLIETLAMLRYAEFTRTHFYHLQLDTHIDSADGILPSDTNPANVPVTGRFSATCGKCNSWFLGHSVSWFHARPRTTRLISENGTIRLRRDAYSEDQPADPFSLSPHVDLADGGIHRIV